jgi:flagellar hook assembly protein FlgD
VHLGLARADRVRVRIYDIAGRQVRVLADRAFEAGEHELRWDGSDDSGTPLARGVYFTRVSYASSGFSDAKRVIVLH